jgi:hypothetical protein
MAAIELTPRPAHTRLDMPADLPRPCLDEMRYIQHFGELTRQPTASGDCLKHLRVDLSLCYNLF